MILDLVIDALAVHRLTKLALDDEIVAPIRNKIFDKYPPAPNSWSYVLTCPWCASIWIGAGVVVARRTLPGVWSPVATGLALSSMTGIMYERL